MYSRARSFTFCPVSPEAPSAAAAHQRVVIWLEALLSLDPGLLLQSLPGLITVPVSSEVIIVT